MIFQKKEKAMNFNQPAAISQFTHTEIFEGDLYPFAYFSLTLYIFTWREKTEKRRRLFLERETKDSNNQKIRDNFVHFASDRTSLARKLGLLSPLPPFLCTLFMPRSICFLIFFQMLLCFSHFIFSVVIAACMCFYVLCYLDVRERECICLRKVCE